MKTEDINKKYVEPIIEPLLSGIAFKPVEKQLNFKQKIAEIATDATDDVLKQLLWDRDWRFSFVGAWLIFIKNKIEFTDDICKLLLQGDWGTMSYCFALAKFGTLKCSEHLCRYLEEELPFDKLPNEGFQDTALYALSYIDNQNKTDFSRQFLEPGGLWTKFVEFKCRVYQKSEGHIWGRPFDENYKKFVRMLDFMNTITTKT